MKQFNLEEYLKDPSKKIVTRDGREVRIICTDRIDENYPIIALVKSLTGIEWCESFTIDGRNSINNRESDLNLFFAPEKKEGWVNIYKRNYLKRVPGTSIFSSEDEAKDAVLDKEGYITTVKIEWEE